MTKINDIITPRNSFSISIVALGSSGSKSTPSVARSLDGSGSISTSGISTCGFDTSNIDGVYITVMSGIIVSRGRVIVLHPLTSNDSISTCSRSIPISHVRGMIPPMGKKAGSASFVFNTELCKLTV
jgi:hypothetical protein